MDFIVDLEKAMNTGLTDYIQESGIYEGMFTEAKFKESQGGTIGVEFTFEAMGGGTASYLTLWLKKADGTELFGLNMFYSLLALLHLEKVSLNANNNYDQVCNKKIKVALQKEEYEKNDSNIGYKLNILRFFSAKTNQCYSEVVNKEEPKAIKIPIKDKLLVNKHQPTKKNNIETSDLPF